MAKNSDTRAIQEANREYTELTNTCKAFAEARRNSRRYHVEMINDWMQGINDYVEGQRTHGKPLTVAGFCLKALGGMPTSSYYELMNGDKDHYLDEYIIANNIDIDSLPMVNGYPVYTDANGNDVTLMPFSELLKVVNLLLQEDREERCLQSSKHNPAGAIFLLKSQHDFVETGNENKPVNQTLNIIADSERAKDIIKLLNG